MRISFRTYSVFTILLTVLVIYNAYDKYKQFYKTGLYLATAKHALLIFTNLVAVLAYLLGKIFVFIYLDRIHERELDLLNDKIKSSITDTILALTIFREHFNTQFVFLFLFLLFFQVFHWLSKYRVEYLEHSPYDFKKNLRLIALLAFLLFVDSVFLYFSVRSLFIPSANKSDYFFIGYTFQPNLMVLFSLEFGLLFITGVSTVIQLFINIEGIKREGRWDNKGIYILYLEFFSEALKTLLYSAFFAITIIHYGIPIHIIRQLFISFRTFIRRLQDILQYQNIMNERFADATEPELDNTDRICIVCREDMVSGKKLPCGHILHLHCLRSWLERQQTCPTCRAQVIIHDPNQPQNLLQRIFRRRPVVQQPPAQPVPVQPQANNVDNNVQPQQQQGNIPPNAGFGNFGANHMFHMRRFGPLPINIQRQQALQHLQQQHLLQQQQQNYQQPQPQPQPQQNPETNPRQTPFGNDLPFPSLFNNNNQHNNNNNNFNLNSPFSRGSTSNQQGSNIQNNEKIINSQLHLTHIQNHLTYLYNQIELLKTDLRQQTMDNIIIDINNNNNNNSNNNNTNINGNDSNNSKEEEEINSMNKETEPKYNLVDIPELGNDNNNTTSNNGEATTQDDISINENENSELSIDDQIRQRVSRYKNKFNPNANSNSTNS